MPLTIKLNCAGGSAQKVAGIDMAKNEHDRYLYGFGSQFQSEALPGALPVGQNSPKECPYGLYAEQLSGTAFTVPPPHNLHTWLYRILPSVCHRPFAPYSRAAGSSRPGEFLASPNQFRWSAFPIDKGVDFVDGLHCLAAAGAPEVRHGVMVHIYGCTQSMERRAFYNADGDFLIGTSSFTAPMRCARCSSAGRRDECQDRDGHHRCPSARHLRHSEGRSLPGACRSSCSGIRLGGAGWTL